VHRLDDLRRLEEAVTVPIAGSENHGTAHWFREALALGVIDSAHFDVGRMGGLSDALDVAVLARAFDRPIAPHDCVGPVMLAADFRLLASQPHGLWCETVRAYARGWYREVVEGLPEPEGGTIGFPEGPGLGAASHRPSWRGPISSDGARRSAPAERDRVCPGARSG